MIRERLGRRARRTRSSSGSLIVMPLIDSPPFDSIIVRGTAARQRPSRSQKTSIENSSPRQTRLHHRVGGRVARGRTRARVAFVGAVDVARAEALARLHEHRERGRRPAARSGSQVGGEPMPCSSKKTCARYLSEQRAIVSAPGHEHDGAAEVVPRLRELQVVEVGQRHDQPDVVQLRRGRAARRCSPGRRRAARARGGRRGRARARAGRRRSRSSSRRRARSAVTMSTRCPAHVKRTAVTAAQGTARPSQACQPPVSPL